VGCDQGSRRPRRLAPVPDWDRRRTRPRRHASLLGNCRRQAGNDPRTLHRRGAGTQNQLGDRGGLNGLQPHGVRLASRLQPRADRRRHPRRSGERVPAAKCARPHHASDRETQVPPRPAGDPRRTAADPRCELAARLPQLLEGRVPRRPAGRGDRRGRRALRRNELAARRHQDQRPRRRRNRRRRTPRSGLNVHVVDAGWTRKKYSAAEHGNRNTL
jgi:hypothetical protein